MKKLLIIAAVILAGPGLFARAMLSKVPDYNEVEHEAYINTDGVMTCAVKVSFDSFVPQRSVDRAIIEIVNKWQYQAVEACGRTETPQAMAISVWREPQKPDIHSPSFVYEWKAGERKPRCVEKRKLAL